jgi:hypothetical protein
MKQEDGIPATGDAALWLLLFYQLPLSDINQPEATVPGECYHSQYLCEQNG